MAFENVRNWLRMLLGRGTEDDSRRPDGGTSFYRPIRHKKTEGNETGETGTGAVPYIHTGFTGMNPPADASVPPYTGQTGFTDSRMNFPQDNISYMPGVQPQQNGMPAYAHVEHVMAMTSLRSCYEAIECMKNGETLIITLDAIANEGERMRCQDMLAGAAFTLGCNVRTLQGGRLVLIAPENVKILPEQPERRMEPPRAWTGYTPPAEEPEPQAPARRERRVSQRSAQWTAARNGEFSSYNPYTGTKPAAAGEYANFGGYGYW